MSEERQNKVALVTGITGQDGSYLTELLLEKGYTVSKPHVLYYICNTMTAMKKACNEGHPVNYDSCNIAYARY